jgi:hypothetical protein
MDFFNYNDNKINLKNIYNIAKLLCHIAAERGKYVFLGPQFKTLSEQQIYVFTYLYVSDELNDINLRKNIEFQEVDNYNYNDILNDIKTSWNNIKIDLVWKYLHFNGLLSEFNINFKLTDGNTIINSEYNDKTKEKQRRLKYFLNENRILLEQNYFMTNKPYTKLKEFENIDSYDKLLVEKLNFYTFYANDWISQLNFFNHSR